MWLTLNIYHEARSEPVIGQLAVGHVTINRAIKTRQSLDQVVLAPYQFSWIHQQKSYMPTETDAFFNCMQSALYALASDDFTNGATFYHRQDIHPGWSEEMDYVAQFGVHKFYRN